MNSHDRPVTYRIIKCLTRRVSSNEQWCRQHQLYVANRQHMAIGHGHNDHNIFFPWLSRDWLRNPWRSLKVSRAFSFLPIFFHVQQENEQDQHVQGRTVISHIQVCVICLDFESRSSLPGFSLHAANFETRIRNTRVRRR